MRNLILSGNYLLIFLLINGCNKMEAPEIPGADQEISIMSFNIRYDEWEDGENKWDNRKEACIAMIEEKAPSVFGIQEGLNKQVYYLEENLGAYARIGVGRDDGDTRGEYCAVFYLRDQYELLDDDTFWLSETPDEPSYGWDADCRRIVTWAWLRDMETEKSFYVFNTHFDHKGNEAREKSATLLVDKINEICDPEAVIFISGDFNARIYNSILDPILDEFNESRNTAEITDSKNTFNAWGKPFIPGKIDFIFYRQADAEKFKTIDKDFGVPYISDHYPIMTNFLY